MNTRPLNERFASLPITRYTSRNKEEMIFIPLPPELWRKSDGGCSCDICKADGGGGYWDTMAIAAKKRKGDSDYTYTVHYPALHAEQVRRAKIAADAPAAGVICTDVNCPVRVDGIPHAHPAA